jgi:autotransporter-associated beta strand protein
MPLLPRRHFQPAAAPDTNAGMVRLRQRSARTLTPGPGIGSIAVAFSLALIAIFAGAGPARAASHTWSGAVNGLWSNSGNWSAGGAPTNGETGLSLVFPAGATRFNTTNNLSALAALHLIFSGSGYHVHGTGTGTNLNVAGGSLESDGVGNELEGTITLTLLSSTLVDVSSGNALTIQSRIAGNGGLTKIGTGTFTLSPAVDNTYVGTTTVNDGTLRLQAGFPFGSIWISAVAVPGTLWVGTSDVTLSPTILLLEGNQIADTASVTIYGNGQLDLNGKNEVIGSLSMSGGLLNGDGPSSTNNGMLTLYGNLSGSSLPSFIGNIDANLSLGGTNRTFDISAGVFNINGNIDGGPATNTAGFTKTGAGTLVLAGATNIYNGATLVNAGTLQLNSGAEPGTTNNGTTINPGGRLLLNGAAVALEPLTLSGTGTNATNGALAGQLTSSWSGPVTLASNATVYVGNGAQLTLSGSIGGPGGLAKTGAGILSFSGQNDNTYAGATTVQGTLRLAKSFIGFGVISVPGSLIVGTPGSAGFDTDVVQLLVANQIANTAPVTIIDSGALDLNNHDDTIGALTMQGGNVIGSAATLTIGGNITILAANFFSSGINGNLSLGGSTRTMDVAQGAFLEIYAAISDGGASAGFIKTGLGTMNLFGNSTFTGNVTVNSGQVAVYNSGAFGAIAGTTTVNLGAQIRLYDNYGSVNVPETIFLNGHGPNNSLDSASVLESNGTNVWSGNVVAQSDCAVAVFGNLPYPGLFTITGAISGPGKVTIAGPGNTSFSGNTDNTYLGGTLVRSGTLLLNKSSGAVAIPSPLVVTNATVRLLLSNQIANLVPVSVNGYTGLLDLNNFSDAIGTLAMNSGSITTGSGLLTLGGDLTIDGDGFANTSAISGWLSLGGTTRTVDASEYGGLVLNASVSDGGPSAGLTKVGLGNLFLQGSNSFSGPVLVNAGRLAVHHNKALGTTASGTTVADGAELDLQDVFVSNESLSIVGNGFGYGVLGVLNTNTWAGPVMLTGPTTVNVVYNDSLLTINGVISGSGKFVQEGFGTLTFAGSQANTFFGVTEVNGGTLLLNKTAGLDAVPQNLRIGTTNGQGVIVRLLNDNQMANSIPNAVRLNDNGTLDLNNRNCASGGITIDGGGITTGTGTLTLKGDISALKAADLAPTSISGKLSLGGASRTFDVATNQTLPIYASIMDNVGGINKTGDGSLLLYLSNSFPGAVNISGGTVGALNDFALGTTNIGTSVASNSTLWVVNFKSAEPLVLSGSGFQNTGAVLSWGSNYLNGPVVLGSDSVINVPFNNTLLAISNVVSGAGGLTKAGNGALRLAGPSNNTLSGAITVQAGTLELAKNAAVAVPGSLFIGDGAGPANGDIVRLLGPEQIANNAAVTISASSGIIHLQGFNETIGSLAGAGEVNLGAGTLTTGGNNASTVFGGLIGNIGSLTKQGSGTFTLTGDNVYSGPTLVMGGKLIVNGSQPASAITLMAGAIDSPTLGGIGTVSTVNSIAGTISPGNSPGKLNTSTVTLDSGSKLLVELNGTVPGSGYDQLSVSGSLAANQATLQVAMNVAGAIGNQYVIVNHPSGSTSTIFAGLSENDIITANNGVQLRISYAGGDGNDTVLTQLTLPVPPQWLSVTSLTNQQIQLTGNGVNGVAYTVQANAGLNPTGWLSIGSVTGQVNGLLQFRDTNAPNLPARFYRLSLP